MNKHRWGLVLPPLSRKWLSGSYVGCIKCEKSFHDLHLQLYKKLNDSKYDINASRTPSSWQALRKKINEEIACEVSDKTYDREKVIKEIIE